MFLILLFYRLLCEFHCEIILKYNQFLDFLELWKENLQIIAMVIIIRLYVIVFIDLFIHLLDYSFLKIPSRMSNT